MYRFKCLEYFLVIILIVTSVCLPLTSLEVADVEPSNFPTTMSTLLRGSSAEESNKILLDTEGNFMVLGTSGSSDFLNMPNASTYYSNPLITKISADGSLQWLTFIADNGRGIGMNLALDNDNNIYVVGEVLSSGFFKTDPTRNDSSAGFVSKN